MIETIDDAVYAVTIPIKERLDIEVLETIIVNFNSDEIVEYNEMVGALYMKVSFTYTPKKLDCDLNIRTTSATRPSTEQPLV